MKIIVIPNEPNPNMTGRHYGISKALVEQGHEVHSISWDMPQLLRGKKFVTHLVTSFTVRQYQYEDFTVHKIRRLPFFWPYINGWLFKRQLRKLYHQLNADVIFTESYTNETEVPKDLPFVYDLADDYAAAADVFGPAYKIAFKVLGVQRTMKRQCKNALAVTAVSDILCDFAKRYNRNVTKVPNGVEAGLIEEVKKDPGYRSKNEHSIVYVSGFGPWSKPIEAMQAVVELREEFPDIELTLIGEGTEVPKMEQFITDHDAQSYIQYLGFIHDRKEVISQINRHAIGLNISEKNSWRDAAHPMKVIEYSALGKKVVSTDLESVKALHAPNVFLFSDTRKNSLKYVLRDALLSQEDYSKQSVAMLNEYAWQKIIGDLLVVISKALKPNIVHVSPSYPPNLGGLEKVVQELATTQAQDGSNVRVITSAGSPGEEITAEPFPVARLKKFVIANTTIMPDLLFKLLRLSSNHVVHLHVTQAFTPEIVWLASKVKGFRYIAHIHLDVPPSGTAGFLLKIYKPLFLKRVLRSAQYVVVFTEDQKTEVVARYGLSANKVVVVPNGVASEFYYNGVRSLHKKPRLLFVGRLGYQKNLQQLLHALEGISDQFETAIIGDGEQGSELRKLAEELRLKNIVLPGRIEGEELRAYYKEADIFVLPSEREGMPLVLLEAMAMGLPVVCTDVTGSQDVIQDKENGLLVPYNDTEAFREALLGLKKDTKLYRKMSQTARIRAEQYSWKKVADTFEKLYKGHAMPQAHAETAANVKNEVPLKKSVRLWQFVLPLLALANAAYLAKDFLGWVFTLGFFLLVPGYLLLQYLEHSIKSHWEALNFSLGLSLLLIMVGGLALNSLHYFGLTRPLATINVFLLLDSITVVLLIPYSNRFIELPSFRLRATVEQVVVSIALTLLPFLAIGGAIRLNNGASNILTMILFAVVPLLFVYLIVRNNLKSLYPYAILMFGLSLLFSTSLRGWFVTGHDIQHEFRVFQAVSNNDYWSVRKSSGDPYNACLSITILPTIIAKLTTIFAPYVYKVVFQTIFAFSVVPIYFLLKKFADVRTSFVTVFVFVSFPTFLNDMPFLNRQEIGFTFFILLLLASFSKISSRSKTALTFLLLFGIVLSHYSTGYTTVLLLALSSAIYSLISWRRKETKLDLPILRLSVIVATFLFIFFWNSQITISTGNLRSVLTDTAHSIISGPFGQEGFVQHYGLFAHSSSQPSPSDALAKTAGTQAPEVQYLPWANLPMTRLGNWISLHLFDVTSVNYTLHLLIAKLFQILMLLGVPAMYLAFRKKATNKQIYVFCMIVAGLIMLILWTVLPQLSIDYTVTRLFQQTLPVTALAIVFAVYMLFGFLKSYRIVATALLFAILFLNLCGFVPEALGGLQPQLPLNNSGLYYDFFYSHKGEILAGNWIAANRNAVPIVDMDMSTSTTEHNYILLTGINNLLDTRQHYYLLLGTINKDRKVYRAFVGNQQLEFTAPSITTDRGVVYVNQESSILTGKYDESQY